MSYSLALPVPAEQLVPHRPPMLLIDQLVEFKEGHGVTEACIPRDSLMVDEDGYIEPSVMIELIAQGYAAVRGFEDLLDKKSVAKGFLVGISHFEIMKRIQAGKKLRITAQTPTYLGDFALADSEVFCEGQCVALGTIKLWMMNEHEAQL